MNYKFCKSTAYFSIQHCLFEEDGEVQLRRTPLFENHLSLKGRMVPFSGWEMPVQYSSILEEHAAVRNQIGMFDVSHMGEISVKGKNAANFLEKVTCNRVSDLIDGQVQYNAVINRKGGLVDDITIYRIGENNFFIVSNASNFEAVALYLKENASSDVVVENESDLFGQIALQGPKADSFFSKFLNVDFSNLKYYHFIDLEWNKENIRVSRTGYTGEDGFEIYASPSTTVKIWNEILSAGKEEVKPAGLGARDILRLEAMYPLYGHELNEELTPVESGIGWIVKEKEIRYPEYEKIVAQKKNGPERKVVPFELLEAGVPREGYKTIDQNGKECGALCSGAFSPILKKGIGSVLLPREMTSEGTDFSVQIREKSLKARVRKGPFVKGTAGRNK